MSYSFAKATLVGAALTLGAANIASATPIVVDTALWSANVAPSSGRISSNDSWTRLADQTPTRASNASGTLVSDFNLMGDFSFSGTFSPIVDRREGSSCNTGGNAICNDNDILGLVFGWQGEFNHYRLGFGQGGEFGVRDITGRQGLFLIREVDGKSKTLFSWDSNFWVDDALYDFNISRVKDELRVSVDGLMRSSEGSQSGSQATAEDTTAVSQVLSTTVTDDTFLNGRVGVYTESQASVFNGLTVDGSSPVPTPAPLTLILAGLSGLLLTRRSRV